MSIHKTPSNTWKVRWKDGTGRQRARTFKRKADASRFEIDTLAALGKGYLQSPDTTTTVKKWASDWLEGAMNLGRGGRDTYQRDLDRYVLPALGDIPLHRLTADQISEFLSDELAGGLAASTVHRHYRTVRRMCQVAVERHKLPVNPCDAVTPPKIEQQEMRFLTVDQVAALANEITDRYRAWVYVAAYGGLRWSESVGLRRGSVDGARVAVTEQLIQRWNGEWDRTEPKSKAGRRVVTLPEFVADILTEHLEEYGEGGADGLVFVNREGSPIGQSTFAGNVFKPALARAGIEGRVRVHDLRHTAVAFAIQAGAHPKAIQSRMGHASISVTLDRYGHLFPEMDGELANALDLLGSPTHEEIRQ